ncbi:MAG: putative toxin-antitoxin system toxin component, PIN family [Aquabacterium sp.]
MPTPSTAPAVPLLVLDTQVVLDLLVFGDPSAITLLAALRAGTVVWLACPLHREEFRRVASPQRCAQWHTDPSKVLAAFDALCHPVPDPAPSGPTVPRCRDLDDQGFIDLACTHHAQALLSRDKAVLALRQRLWRDWRVVVQRPQDWQPRAQLDA